jgi:hypothetical protein
LPGRGPVATIRALTPAAIAAVQRMFDEMREANAKMDRDHEEIERVKAETREILARLKAA